MGDFELNKIVAAILIALLTIKGADLISNHLVHPKMLTENAFKIAGVPSTSSVSGTQTEKRGPAPIEPLLAKANAQNGAIIFKKCTSCHTAEKGGPNKIGPDLYNVLNAQKGKHPGFTYSQAMEKKGGTWTYEDLNHFLYDPRAFLPGTKMSFAGLKNDQERADVIAYLRQQNDTPPPLPEVKAAPEVRTTPEVKPADTPNATPAPATQPKTETPKPTPRSSSRNSENLSDSLDFLNIRDPGLRHFLFLRYSAPHSVRPERSCEAAKSKGDICTAVHPFDFGSLRQAQEASAQDERIHILTSYLSNI
jgi:cytochrome c